MRSDGSQVKRITFGKGLYGTPVWSPRGDLIAFTKVHKGRFYIGVMRTDGSGERLLTENYYQEAPSWSPNGRVLIFFRETKTDNKGKGFSVKKGILNASGSHVTFQDADLEYDPADFKKFEKIFSDFNADGVIGSRFVYSNYTRSHNILNKIGNTLLTLVFNLLYNTTFTDIYSCYFAF